MAEAFCVLLDGIIETPKMAVSMLPLLNHRQQQQLHQWNDTAHPYPTAPCLHHLFESQVQRTPKATALIAPDQTLTYQALNSRANQLAHRLQALGVGPETRVGVCLDRAANLVVALLAILKAGGAYVPLDPAYPKNRLTYILEDAQISVVLTQQAYQAITTAAKRVVFLDPLAESDSQPVPSPVSAVQPNNLAYIIYTSGSTGKPKGVAIEHRSPVTLVHWAQEVFSSKQLSGVLAATSVCFDLSVFEIFVPLSSGGAIILAENALQLPNLPAAHPITLINTVPTAIAELVRINAIPSSVSTINLAGEPIPPILVKQLYALESVQQVYNLYGPSEDTTYSTYTLLSPEDPVVSIGRPIANTQTHVLDEQHNPVPIGMPGELYLAGDGVARGYWNRPELTAEKFVPNPFGEDRRQKTEVRSQESEVNSQESGVKISHPPIPPSPHPPIPPSPLLYKTGDLVRHRPDGLIDFLGRIDNQVKIRGFRIELGEIEAALLQHPEIIQAAVNPWVDDQDNRRLAAYVVFAEAIEGGEFGTALSPFSGVVEGLRSHLLQTLPDYMAPAVFVSLATLPLLPNGKLNRKALPTPIIDEAQDNDALSPPRTATEQQLVKIWQELLRRPVGIHDNFFELGGDSILAIQSIAKAQQVGLYFSPRDLFQHSTIDQLAAVASQQVSTLAQQSPIVGPVPLTPIQHWFFEQRLQHPHHWNQSVLLTVRQTLQPELLTQALRQLMHHHDALRAVFQQTEAGWRQQYAEPSDKVPLRVVRKSVDDVAEAITATAATVQSSFDLSTGPLWQVVYFELETTTGPERRLLMVCHHLLVDGLSWRILLGDLQALYQQFSQTGVAQLPPKTFSCQNWIERLAATDRQLALSYWEKVAALSLPPLPQDFPGGRNHMALAETVSVSLTQLDTQRLLQDAPIAYSVHINDLLLTALVLALKPWAGQPLRISLEGHGRPDDFDLSRTVGWFTTLYPVLLDTPPNPDLGGAIKAVKETLRGIPNQGLGYDVLRYLQPDVLGEVDLKADAPIRFNYLGQTDQLFSDTGWLAPATEPTGPARSPHDTRDILIEINALVSQGRLNLHWTYSRELHRQKTIVGLAETYLTQLKALIDYCLSSEIDRGYSPADFPQMGLEQGELDDLLTSLGGESS